MLKHPTLVIRSRRYWYRVSDRFWKKYRKIRSRETDFWPTFALKVGISRLTFGKKVGISRPTFNGLDGLTIPVLVGLDGLVRPSTPTKRSHETDFLFCFRSYWDRYGRSWDRCRRSHETALIVLQFVLVCVLINVWEVSRKKKYCSLSWRDVKWKI